MLYIVCYDISNDRTRDHMSDRLLDFGVRIQESVFECLLDDQLYQRLLEGIGKTPLGPDDKVRVYRLCSYCVDTVQIYGKGEMVQDPDFYLV